MSGPSEVVLVDLGDKDKPSYSAVSSNGANGSPTKEAPALIPLKLEDSLPTNVCTEEQMATLPSDLLSDDPVRPLRHVDEQGAEFHYALKPMFYSVVFILLIELLERFAFYGINYTQTSFLTGAYNDDWNAGFSAISASTYVSVSTAVAYTTPFAGAFLADAFLGDYWSMMVGLLFMYLPGLCTITLTTVPGLLGETFSNSALSLGLLVLWPVGTGIVKSIVNVFGAKQFHPLIQTSLIETYYVNFYMCINIGALAGGIVVPIVAQKNVTVAYMLPVAMLGLGVVLFVMGSKRYVRTRPRGDLFARKVVENPDLEPIGLRVIMQISMLIVPFNIAYSQMSTTFIIQGSVMQKAFGFIDAACMNNADAVAVLLFGYLIGNKLYPFLNKYGIKLPTTYKFAIGSTLGAMALGWSLIVDNMVHQTYQETGEKISIMWQSLSYILIGAGEVFAVSAAYEVAFTASPPESKVLASAMNLFCVGGIPNVLCIALYNSCHAWFRNSRGNASIHRIEDYATAHVYKYFLLLFTISLTGVFINLLPPVREFVASIEDRAMELAKTPKLKRPRRPKRDLEREETFESDEESPLLGARRHQQYLKYGRGPVLYKSGSMRAGPSMSHKHVETKPVTTKIVRKMYKSDSAMPTVMLGPGGRPVTAGDLPPATLPRSHSETEM